MIAVLHNLGHGGARRRLGEQVAHLGLDVLEVTTSAAEPVTERHVVVPLQTRAERAPGPLRPPLRWLDLRDLMRAWEHMGQVAVASGAKAVMVNPDRFLGGAVPSLVTAVPTLAYVDEPRRVDHEPPHHTRTPTTRGLDAPLRRRQAALDWHAVRFATRVATSSRYSAARIQAAYGRPATVVPCGVPERFLHGDGERGGPASHVLTVGAAVPTKGHDLVIRAAAASGLGLPVVLVTDRDGSEVRRLSTVAAEVGVALDVRVRVSDDELTSLYRRALATVVLPQAEPLGLVSLEAQACGCPVVVADEGGLPETVTDGVTGYVVPRDPEAAAQALHRLADPGLRQPMARAARQRVEGLTWRAATGHLRTHLVELTESRHPRYT